MKQPRLVVENIMKIKINHGVIKKNDLIPLMKSDCLTNLVDTTHPVVKFNFITGKEACINNTSGLTCL